MKITPHKARYYLFYAVLLLALPSILSQYQGHTGKILVATDAVNGTPFEGTVIYLVKHDLWSAQGFIINKPLENAVDGKMPLFYGGPVGFPATTHVMVPDQAGYLNGVMVEPYDGQASVPDKKNARVFSGYAGWGVFQLNGELFRGAWDVIDYDPDLMFSNDLQGVYPRALDRVPVTSVLPAGGA